jgi:hypothetical protein
MASTPTKLLLGLAVLAAPAWARRVERPVRDWQPLHYRVQLELGSGLSTLRSARTELRLR